MGLGYMVNSAERARLDNLMGWGFVVLSEDLGFLSPNKYES